MESAGVEVPIDWRGRRALAFVPARLSERDLALDAQAVASSARARADLEHAAESMPADHAALARLLLRSEGLASSYIEGVTAPVVDVVVAEIGRRAAPSVGGWVAANLAAVTAAVERAHHDPLSVEMLCDWHRKLMEGSPTPARHVGVVRQEQGWIGGTSPLDAHLVTPPPDRVPELLDDLVEYANSQDGDPVAQAAIAHAQFEIIHPFADGNGRIGRILIAWILVRRLALLTPPPVSAMIAADVGGYGSGLVLFRLGDHNAWVRWFADVATGAGRRQEELVASVEGLQSSWRDRLAAPRPGSRALRADATAWRVLELLPGHLLLTAPAVAGELGVPLKTATAALDQLVAAGILTERASIRSGNGGRPSRLYVSEELLGLSGATALRGRSGAPLPMAPPRLFLSALDNSEPFR